MHRWMHRPLVADGGLIARAGASAVLAGSIVAHGAAAFTPNSPEVKRAVAKAVEFLESDTAGDNRLGAKALVGLALLKSGAEPDHPKVVDAVSAIQATVAGGDPRAIDFDEMYTPGVAVIFLVALDPSRYAAEIQCFLDYLQLQQKPHGGWGYPTRETGDTSMTQYAVLCLWEATQAGFRVPGRSIEKVATWLLKTQDPSGAFGYQGQLSASFTPIPQHQIRPSLTAAGLGSVYICADLLGVAAGSDDQQDELPPALEEIGPQRGLPWGQLRPKTRLDPRLFRAVQARGNRWMAAHYVINPEQWTHYYLYALERYMSFRELAEGGPVGGARWYDDGVRFLRKTQAEDGRWAGEATWPVDTAFCVLFLTRSMKKSLEKARTFGEGTLVGGRGLPKEAGRAEVRDGRVVAEPSLGPAEQLLAVLEGSEKADYGQAIEAVAAVPAEQFEALIGPHAEKLRRLAADESVMARIAAVRALGKTGRLDNVPTLIYALSDANLEVAREARDALRRISRKPAGFGLPDRPAEADRREAIRQWKAWYLAVRPDAEFDHPAAWRQERR